MSTEKCTLIMDADHMRRAITRIAHEICERNRGGKDVVLVGILHRGDILAQRIAAQMEKIEGMKPPVGALDITFHRDDQSARGLWPSKERSSDIPFPVDDKHVVLVDDVLYTGRSIRAAMDELNDFGRPQSIQLAVLVDRGHRELPIHADFVGKNVPTAHQQQVAVRLQERDGQEAVLLLESETAPGNPGEVKTCS